MGQLKAINILSAFDKLALTGSPDKPSHLAITNITLTSATVTWDTGFNGGANQTLFIR